MRPHHHIDRGFGAEARQPEAQLLDAIRSDGCVQAVRVQWILKPVHVGDQLQALRAVLSRSNIDKSIAVVDLRIAVDVFPERIARKYSHVRCSFQSRLREVRRQRGCDTRRGRLIRGAGRQAKRKCR